MTEQILELAPKTPIKLALVVERAHMPLAYLEASEKTVTGVPTTFWGINTRLVDRAICEKDESTLQLLPYMVLKSGDRYFQYSRGAGGTEARLHANTSIGIGGHVDGNVPENMDLKAWLQDEALREMMEEVGLEPDHPIEFVGLIADPTNEVGRVHCGILAVVSFDRDVTGTVKQEKDNIENGEWLTLAELQEADRFAKLENWSQAAVHFLVNLSLIAKL